MRRTGVQLRLGSVFALSIACTSTGTESVRPLEVPSEPVSTTTTSGAGIQEPEEPEPPLDPSLLKPSDVTHVCLRPAELDVEGDDEVENLFVDPETGAEWKCRHYETWTSATLMVDGENVSPSLQFDASHRLRSAGYGHYFAEDGTNEFPAEFEPSAPSSAYKIKNRSGLQIETLFDEHGGGVPKGRLRIAGWPLSIRGRATACVIDEPNGPILKIAGRHFAAFVERDGRARVHSVGRLCREDDSTIERLANVNFAPNYDDDGNRIPGPTVRQSRVRAKTPLGALTLTPFFSAHDGVSTLFLKTRRGTLTMVGGEELLVVWADYDGHPGVELYVIDTETCDSRFIVTRIRAPLDA